jgi:N-acetyl-anhydromuramyl-L-alanine amidase AmpD
MIVLSQLFCVALWLATQPGGAVAAGHGTAIMVAGQPVDLGRTVVLWSDEQGFDGYDLRCIDQSGGCCDVDWARYGARRGLAHRTLADLQGVVSQFVLHFDGCVNSRSCFKSMHNRVRPGGGCGLSAHFMIDSDGTIYQTLDLAERAFHAEQENSISVGVEICNRGRYQPSEMSRLPAEYRTRPRRQVVINGTAHDAYDFRPEQYESLVSLSRALLRIFPKMKPIIPERDGQPLLETLAQPLDFHGIVGHLHVDLQKQKWDPGALDWNRVVRALRGFSFPIQIRAFSEVPRTRDELLAARKAGFFASEERVTGFFPLAPARLWHSGVHLRGLRGSPVLAPARGRIVAARQAEENGRSTAFVLMRHEVELDGRLLTFFSLLFHLSLPSLSDDVPIPWMRTLMQPERAAQRVALESGAIVLLDERVEAGDRVGVLGSVNRGPEQGPELHFEIFTADKPPPALGKSFHYLNAAADGPIVRRAALVSLADRNNDSQIDADELRRLFHGNEIDPRQALRRLVILHRHEWGSRTTPAEFMGLRELSGISEADRRRIYAAAIEPYIFWTDALAAHAGLPASQIIYSYNPITFLVVLAAQAAHVEIPWPRDSISDGAIEPRQLVHVPVDDWTKPPASVAQELQLPPLVGVDLAPKRKDQIPLIELPPTDER